MHGPDQIIAAVVALMFLAGLVVIYRAVRQRSLKHRNWDNELVGVRAPSGAGLTVPKPSSADRK